MQKRAKTRFHLPREYYNTTLLTTMPQREPLKAIDGNRGYKQELSV
jgi:hypothetical protein